MRPRRAFALAGTLAVIAGSAQAQAARLGQFQRHADVGSPKLAGSAVYDADAQQYMLSAGGVNMWARRDEFHFAWKLMKGDFILQAGVELLGKGVDPHRKAGWMVRTSLADDSPCADAVVHGDGLTSLQYRRDAGAITGQIQSAIKSADVIQLERKGTSFILSAARFGDPFTVTQVSELDLGDEVYVGLFLCSHNPDVVEKAVFRNVRIIRPAGEGFVAYREYIGSHLEVLDVENGRRQILMSSERPFEAPNWTPDGKALIYNTSGPPENRGRLRRFDLARRQSSPIDTGFAIRNNNDHVLSFDGKRLGISDQSSEGGQSTVFTLPVEGGVPLRRTRLTPSYLHGWSPDGKWIAFLSYGRDVEPAAHPYYKHVYIRLKPVDGGPSKVIAYVYGGQGTINVPSWAPDSKRLAFVSNSDKD